MKLMQTESEMFEFFLTIVRGLKFRGFPLCDWWTCFDVEVLVNFYWTLHVLHDWMKTLHTQRTQSGGVCKNVICNHKLYI